MNVNKEKKEYIVFFPIRLASNISGVNFINNIYRDVNSNKYMKVIFNFESTYIFETNMIAILAYAIEKIYSNKIALELIIADHVYRDVDRAEIVRELFNYFSDDKCVALMPRKIGNTNLQVEENLLLNDLKMLQLAEYERVRTIISEIIANLKMHTIWREGYFSGYHDYKNHQIIFTIVNYDIAIANCLKQVQDMEFENDDEAIVWALKKNNTTRQNNESGGIGLYLLRKYIYLLDGRFSISSGDAYIECDKTCYSPENENFIQVRNCNKLAYRFEGTIITLYIPDKTQMIPDKKRIIEEIRLEWLLEE